ncbi:MAG: AlpA family phage regulatory protein [Deltaproteobacteria bacterium]|nr:MAG: AlpA family phage regulatory protein [Deltaproteobacteria bacterium]
MPKEQRNETTQDLPRVGLLRIKQVLKFIPISRSSWWAGIREGKFPPGRKLGVRTTVWAASDILKIIEGGQP